MLSEKIKTHILCSIIFFFEIRALYEIMWKNIVQLDTDDSLAHAHWMLDTYGYKHTLRIFHSYYLLLEQWLYESESKYLACLVMP